MGGAPCVAAMLTGLSPELLAEEYVFCTVSGADAVSSPELEPLATFREREGLTLVLERRSAQAAGFDCAIVFCCITLGLNSSLEAVGLTAVVAQALAQRGISANVIAAYHHDHIFVPTARAAEALKALQTLQF